MPKLKKPQVLVFFPLIVVHIFFSTHFQFVILLYIYLCLNVQSYSFMSYQNGMSWVSLMHGMQLEFTSMMTLPQLMNLETGLLNFTYSFDQTITTL
jgi:hypothetical protein